MLNRFNTASILDTIEMIDKYRLDIRTVTMGISLLSCTRSSMDATAQAVYDLSLIHISEPTRPY